MNAKKRLSMLAAMGEFISKDTLTNKGLTALMGEHPDEEKFVFKHLSDFSWNAKQAVQMAIGLHRESASSVQKKISMMEIAKVIPALRPHELLAVHVAIGHGVEGLLGIKPALKILRVKK